MVKVKSKHPIGVNFIIGNKTITINGLNSSSLIITDTDFEAETLIEKEDWEQIQKQYKDNSLIKGKFIDAVGVKDNAKEVVDVNKKQSYGAEVKEEKPKAIK